MNKFQFIKHLLDTKKYTPAQKERFFKLVSAELADVGIQDKKILEDIRLIKEQIGFKETRPSNAGVLTSRMGLLSQIFKEEEQSTNQDIKTAQSDRNKSRKDSKKLPEPNPKHVADFMSLFNQREGLKYLTHDFDENSQFEIDKFLVSAKKVFDHQTYNNLNIPISLWRIVKQFAFDSMQTAWTSISEDYKKSIPITVGWASKELRDWSKQNHLHPIRNEHYKKIINDFRRITRIEPHNLEALINATLETTFEKEIDNFEVRKIDLSRADFYSHVGFLKNAIETIFEEIKNYSDSPHKKDITIKYERSISDDGYYLRKIIITHHNSFPIKEKGLLLKEWNEKGNMGNIKEKLRGYCHWSIETIIENIPTRVNILRENKAVECEKVEFKPDGFTHVLTFYYK